jgi:hypothetical protein
MYTGNIAIRNRGKITIQRSTRALYNRYRIKVSRELIKQQRIARAEQIADPGVTR